VLPFEKIDQAGNSELRLSPGKIHINRVRGAGFCARWGDRQKYYPIAAGNNYWMPLKMKNNIGVNQPKQRGEKIGSRHERVGLLTGKMEN
jgi:hypothetical protein